MFLYDFATKTAQKPDTVATYIRRNEKIFKNHVERREKQLWLDEKAVKILLKKYPEVQRKSTHGGRMRQNFKKQWYLQ